MAGDGKAKWQQLSKEPFYSCPFYTFSHDRYRLPDGSTGDYYYLDIPGASMVVLLTEQGDLLLVRQYRYLMGRHSLEFPAGGMREPGDPRLNARNELEEEAGFAASDLREIGRCAPYNGASNELCHVYLATGLQAVNARPDPTEEMELISLSPDQVARLIRTGEIWDGQTISAFYYFVLDKERGPR